MASTAITEDAAIALTDADLLWAIYEWVGQVDDDDTLDALYRLITEAFERFAPELEWAQVERVYRDDFAGSHVEDELEASRHAFRRREGARILRRLLDDGEASGDA